MLSTERLPKRTDFSVRQSETVTVSVRSRYTELPKKTADIADFLTKTEFLRRMLCCTAKTESDIITGKKLFSVSSLFFYSVILFSFSEYFVTVFQSRRIEISAVRFVLS